MYAPLQVGIPASARTAVMYREFRPQPWSKFVCCFWMLKTRRVLNNDFHYLVLPDGCVDVVFDTSTTPVFEGGLIMTPGVTAVRLNLGRSFSYVGIRFRPGTWLATPQDVVGQMLAVDTLAGYSLRLVRQSLQSCSPPAKLTTLEQLVAHLERNGIIAKSEFAEVLTAHRPNKVEDYIQLVGLSRRHFQRTIKERIGYNPHDFLKIMRFQQALRYKTSYTYADQSHFIREFKRITGMTPRAFHAEYGMSDLYNHFAF